MQGWIHGNQVMSLAQMSDLEIVQGCITKSLTPHNDHGLPIKPVDVMIQHISDLEKEVMRLDELAWDLSGAEREKMILEQIEPLQERLQDVQTYLKSIKTSNWDEFSLPTDPGIGRYYANFLTNSRYLSEEVKRFLPTGPDSTDIEQPPQVETKAARSVYAQGVNKKCREIATRIWDRQPDFTIAAMVNHSEIIHRARKPDGSSYSEMTIRNWIRDLCPNPKPGRRPNSLFNPISK
jgi:hypothetical protein